MKLIKKEKLTETFKCYDLTVKDTHTYVVEGVVVHNSQSRLGISKWTIDSNNYEQNSMNMEVYQIFDEEDNTYAIWKAGSNNVNRKRPNTFGEMKLHPYWFPYTNDNIYNMMEYLIMEEKHIHVQLFGEVLGGGISGGSKSLHYGIGPELDYYAFGLKINDKKVGYKQFKELCDKFEVKTVPEVAIMPYNFEEVKKLAMGKSILAQENKADHIREGVVVCVYDEVDGNIAKFLNPDYLLLKESGKIEDFTDE
jgi:hypothetical protein